MRYSIPLSYNPINVPRLSEILNRYEGVHHNQIITDLEAAISSVTGSPYAVALNSGTSAIHLALKVLGVGPGDYVIAPTFTYVATINPIMYLGAIPVLVDSEPVTWNMDPDLFQKAIIHLQARNIRPKALIVVHTYGMPAHMDTIARLAMEADIPVIEDAAESLGSMWQGRYTGTIGDIGVYSFNNNKIVTTYGGGMLVTRQQALADKARFLASQSRENQLYYEHKEVGYNYKMSPLNAAHGLASLAGLQEERAGRRAVYEKYARAFSSFTTGASEIEGSASNRWLSVFSFKVGLEKVRLSIELATSGIEVRPCWKPMHQQPVYQTHMRFLSGISDSLFSSGLCLPSSFSFNDGSQDLVIERVLKSVG